MALDSGPIASSGRGPSARSEEHHELLLTYSNVLALDAEPQAGLVGCIDGVADRDLDGRLRESSVTHLVVARKE